jgi:hypothetical protein
MPVFIAASQYASSSASAGLRSSDSPYATVPTVSAISSEWPLGEPSPWVTAGGIFPTARPSATSAMIGKNPSASMYTTIATVRPRLVSATSRATRSRGDAAILAGSSRSVAGSWWTIRRLQN